MEAHDESYAIGKPFCSICNHKDNGKIAYKTGQYNHANGTVMIYQQGFPRADGQKDSKYLCLSAYKSGRGHHRTIKGKLYTDIGIARKAGEFARELYEKKS